MKKSLIYGILLLVFSMTGTSQESFSISQQELRDKIEGYWIGQLVGNYMGFPFEWMYFEKPAPVFIDRYYNVNDSVNFRIQQDRRGHVNILGEALGGAWSDDDTDIEFVTLHAVEKYGLDITYAEIAEAWKTHINRFIWGSNRKARELMDEGLIPPATGSKEHNPYWMHIDPQLVNEIWSVFYPGMVNEAVKRADWGAYITNDDWGTHPTRFYAALYSAAFFEDDIENLYEIGMESLPTGSPFLPALKDVKSWHSKYPDWRKTRDLIYNKYYKYPEDVGPHNDVSVIINGLFGAMAILYGNGDFVRTTGIAVTAGLDCDNQAATCAGLIGVLHGASSIPVHLTTDLGDGKIWSEPFNNQYINYSRDGLPNLTLISDIVDRILAIAEMAILENGGNKKTDADHVIQYTVRIHKGLK
ncbi:MAG: ADP-ribosylglycohydrolase family protein [Bacteroidales bacterium]|nr:ADP-ribosylglycohydrolase family protein [Bacteroidales bacterium]